MTTLTTEQRGELAGRRAERLLKAARGAKWLATMTTGHAPSNLMRRSRELRDEHRAEMREALHPVCLHPGCTLHAGHRGTHWDSLAGVSLDGRKGAEVRP